MYVHTRAGMSKLVLKGKKRGKSALPGKATANPTLDTIRMIEQTLAKMLEYSSKNKLWRSLPKQVQYPTFRAVLDYLAESKKIIYDTDGTIIWTFVDNPKLKRLVETSRTLP